MLLVKNFCRNYTVQVPAHLLAQLILHSRLEAKVYQYASGQALNRLINARNGLCSDIDLYLDNRDMMYTDTIRSYDQFTELSAKVSKYFLERINITTGSVIVYRNGPIFADCVTIQNVYLDISTQADASNNHILVKYTHPALPLGNPPVAVSMEKDMFLTRVLAIVAKNPISGKEELLLAENLVEDLAHMARKAFAERAI